MNIHKNARLTPLRREEMAAFAARWADLRGPIARPFSLRSISSG